VRLRAAPRGTTAKRGVMRSSWLPCRVDVLNLLVEIDTTVAAWEHGKSTIDRLHQLACHRWWTAQIHDQVDRHGDDQHPK
jgi:hypothetical protein